MLSIRQSHLVGLIFKKTCSIFFNNQPTYGFLLHAASYGIVEIPHSEQINLRLKIDDAVR